MKKLTLQPLTIQTATAMAENAGAWRKPDSKTAPWRASPRRIFSTRALARYLLRSR